jgi:hypothetical protein
MFAAGLAATGGMEEDPPHPATKSVIRSVRGKIRFFIKSAPYIQTAKLYFGARMMTMGVDH